MSNFTMLVHGATHQTYATIRRLSGGTSAEVSEDVEQRDRGAVSLEQVLWFAAAGVSVAVIAAILWNQIFNAAERPIDIPQEPDGG